MSSDQVRKIIDDAINGANETAGREAVQHSNQQVINETKAVIDCTVKHLSILCGRLVKAKRLLPEKDPDPCCVPIDHFRHLHNLSVLMLDMDECSNWIVDEIEE